MATATSQNPKPWQPAMASSVSESVELTSLDTHALNSVTRGALATFQNRECSHAPSLKSENSNSENSGMYTVSKVLKDCGGHTFHMFTLQSTTGQGPDPSTSVPPMGLISTERFCWKVHVFSIRSTLGLIV